MYVYYNKYCKLCIPALKEGDQQYIWWEHMDSFSGKELTVITSLIDILYNTVIANHPRTLPSTLTKFFRMGLLYGNNFHLKIL